MKNKKSLRALLHLGSTSLFNLVFSIVLSIISVLLMLVAPLGIQLFINNIHAKTRWFFLVFAAMMLLLQGLAQAGALYTASLWAETKVIQIRDLLFARVVKLPVDAKILKEPVKLSGALVNDSEVIRKSLANTIPDLVSGLLTITGGIVFLLVLSWQMTIVLALSISLLLLVINMVSAATEKISRARQNELSTYVSHVAALTSELKMVKALSGERSAETDIHNSTSKLYRFAIQSARINALLEPLIITSVFLVFFVVFAIGGFLVSSNALTIGALITYLIYLFQIISPLTSLGGSFNQLHMANGASDRLAEILQHPIEDLSQGSQLSTLNEEPIVLDDLTFSYDKKIVLSKLSLSIPANSNVALVGPSGGGKTTIFSLLERYVTPDSGTIKLGNQNVNSINLKLWRQKIGYVSQENTLLGNTVRQVLIFGLESGHLAESVLWDALTQVNLKENVAQLPQKLDSPLENHGRNLSGGQIQRLMIARALIRQPQLLLLDEATASLDSDTEVTVGQALKKVKKGRTVITIAHRLSTIKDADQIFFIEAGRVSGHGTHDQLLRRHPTYARYVKEQTI
ncbi:ABC transporter ATP-binding protein [Oenococcus sicerae]|uniref:ABC transporter ATP-binding protein n=1 Tax=Oenococcus sicerae TaxID=2203724 RepID=UPI0010B295FD|nr:Multidrug resistance ABC transporter ATP-binding and permease protein [Oenococcus sicerae]